MTRPLNFAQAMALLDTGEWEVARDVDSHGRTWMQHGKIGCGGEAHDLNRHSFDKMRRLKLIRVVRSDWPSEVYHRTAMGTDAAHSVLDRDRQRER